MLTWGRLELNYDRTGLSIPARYNVMRSYTCDTKEMPAPVPAPPGLHNRELNTLRCFINHPGTVNGLSYVSLWLPSLDSLLLNVYFLPEFGAIFQECRGEGNCILSCGVYAFQLLQSEAASAFSPLHLETILNWQLIKTHSFPICFLSSSYSPSIISSCYTWPMVLICWDNFGNSLLSKKV